MNLINKVVTFAILLISINAYGDTVVQDLMKDKLKQKVEHEMGFYVTKIELNRPEGLTGRVATLFRGEYTREAFIYTSSGFILNCIAEIEKSKPNTATLYNCSIYKEKIGILSSMQSAEE